ncbi:MAG: hypothetical protein BGWL_c3740 [Candidatus Phytoplasma cynodontis]|nr:MAG: hypothetical protein BGWL_c3740 [Candidatus Phytoplasma cynodontis]
MNKNEIETIYINNKKEILPFLINNHLMILNDKTDKLDQMQLLIENKNFHCQTESDLKGVYIISESKTKPAFYYNYCSFTDLDDLINTHLDLFTKKKVYFFRKKKKKKKEVQS